MNGLDMVILIILGVSVIYSLFRGFVREVFSLLSIILAFIAASKLFPFLTSFLVQLVTHKAIANILGFILIFFIACIIINLVGKLVRRLVIAIKLGPVDRVLGAALGFFKAVLVIMVIVLILHTRLPASHPILTQSRLSPYFITLGRLSLDKIPDGLRETILGSKESFAEYWDRLTANPGRREGEKLHHHK